jgi:hypothetical protein
MHFPVTRQALPAVRPVPAGKELYMTPVLMIIDLQEEFFAEGILKDNRSKLITKINQPIDY